MKQSHSPQNIPAQQTPPQAPSSAGGRSARLLCLDAVKAFAILAVILTHVGDIPDSVKRICLWPYTVIPAVPVFMICSIFAYCLAEDKTQGTILSWFSTKTFCRRAGSVLIPFMVAILATVVGICIIADASWLPLSSVFQMVMQGGKGPGAYYTLLVIQLLVVFPFLRHAYNKNHMATVVCLVVLHIGYEFLCKTYKMDADLYQVLIFRFFTHFALGFLLYSYHEQLKGTVLPAVCILIGAIYLYYTYWGDYRQVFVYKYVSVSLIPALYSFGILCYVLHLEPLLQRVNRKLIGQALLRPILHTGKASYHIMLTQMVYFYFVRRTGWEAQLGSWPIALVADVAICLAAGRIFYSADTFIRK